MNSQDPQETFSPPFCPRPECPEHFPSGKKFWVRNGIEHTQKAPGKNQKYRCTRCGKGFSYNTFSIDFRKKIPGISEEVFTCSLSGMSNNSIAHKIKVAEATVRNRLTFLARQSLLMEKEITPKIQIKESVAYDGFETFTYDQYSPCYINTAVGSDSLFTYSTTFSPLNRKGRMTAEQKVKLKYLVDKHGRYPSNSIYEASLYAFKELQKKSDQSLLLYTDEHKSYTRALTKLKSNKIQHIKISSKMPRTTSNPLFPINHLHRNYRHFFSSQHRETISFQKHEAGLMDKIQLMKTQKNFMKPKFARANKIDPEAGSKSPAMYIGATDRILEFENVFPRRRVITHYELDQMEGDFYEREYQFSRRKIAYL